MEKIRKIPGRDAGRFVDIIIDAYPGIGIKTAKDRKKLIEEVRTHTRIDPRTSIHGLYRAKELIGVMRLFDFKMNLFGRWIGAGGLGSLAVSLFHKKEHVAKKLVQHYVRHYRRRKAPLAVLWPFRPDFYKQMGWGLGGQLFSYSVAPQSLPRNRRVGPVRLLVKDDMPALTDCYNRAASRRTGMIEELCAFREFVFDLKRERKYLGYEQNGQIRGYLIFQFERGRATNFIDNNIRVSQLIYDDPEVLRGLLDFLHRQFDQINRIIIECNDESFHHLLHDPRNGSNNIMYPVYHECCVCGVGVMYRIIDARELFAQLADHDFNGHDGSLKLEIKDSFLRANNGSLVLRFDEGKPHILDRGAEYDVAMRIDVADLSSLVLGAVSLRSLNDYGLVKLSDPTQLQWLDDLFACRDKPVCMTAF